MSVEPSDTGLFEDRRGRWLEETGFEPSVPSRERAAPLTEDKSERDQDGCFGARLAHDKRQMRLRRRGTDGLSTHCWREMDSNLYGAFPVKWCFSVYRLPPAKSLQTVPALLLFNAPGSRLM